MPAIVGVVNVNSVSGVFNIGDVRIISPRTISKTFAGGGSFNSGTNLNVNNANNILNVYDQDVLDEPMSIEENWLSKGRR